MIFNDYLETARRRRLLPRGLLLCWLAVALVPISGNAQESEPEEVPVSLAQVFNATDGINDAQRRSQSRINQLVDETETLEGKYKVLLKEIEGLRVYNEQLRRQIQAQIQTIEDVEKAIIDSVVISRQITPLMIRMVDGLDQFVRLDTPFLKGERSKRILRLRENIDRADVSVSEKFNAVLNAYQIEAEYGRTIEAYSGVLPGTEKVVDFLRFGRVSLVYQTTEGDESGAWDAEGGAFVILANSYNSNIRQGIRIARKQVAVDMMILPVAGPKRAQ